MGWHVIADNDQEKVKRKDRDDGGTEFLHIYKDPELKEETRKARLKNQPYDHVTFDSDGKLKYDSTTAEPTRKEDKKKKK